MIVLLVTVVASSILCLIGTRKIKILSASVLAVAVSMFFILDSSSIEGNSRRTGGSNNYSPSNHELLQQAMNEKDILALVPQRVCSTSRFEVGVRDILKKASRLNLQHSVLRLLEEHLITEVRENSDKTSPKLIECYLQVAEALNSIPNTTDMPPFFKELVLLNEQISQNNDIFKKLARMESKLRETEVLQKKFDEMAKDVIYMSGYVIAEHSPMTYEIRDGYGQLALLRTTKTSFSSRGKFYLNVKKVGSFKSTTSKASGGFSVDVPGYMEVPVDNEVVAKIQEYKESLPHIKAQLGEAENLLAQSKSALQVAIEKALAIQRIPASVSKGQGL